VEYSDYLRALQTTHPDLAADLASFRGLSGVMGWMRDCNLSLAGVEIVQQDECNLDFVVPLGPEKTRLAFGIT
jgi:hypothetical protein